MSRIPWLFAGLVLAAAACGRPLNIEQQRMLAPGFPLSWASAKAAPRAPQNVHTILAPSDLQWGPPPPGLPEGARAAVVSGDPTQAQPFVVRLQLPANYRVSPHWHPTAENITVLEGTTALGMGDKFDEAAMREIPTGGFATLPAESHHFFMARTPATIQLHGMGPFAITYVNPADDPRVKN